MKYPAASFPGFVWSRRSALHTGGAAPRTKKLPCAAGLPDLIRIFALSAPLLLRQGQRLLTII